MKFSFNWLKEYLSFDVSPQELADLLTLYSFEAEVLGKKNKDYILDIDILPNRFADAASHFGVVREMQVLLKIVKDKSLKLKDPAKEKLPKSSSSFKIDIQNEQLCSRYAGALVENISVKSSPQWLQDKLAACGVASINNIVDITNFVMLELGQPIHAFDFDKIDNQQIIIRSAESGEKIKLLDGSETQLKQENLVIADAKGALALAGIKGGQKAELNKQTRNIFLEAAHFDKKNIFLSSKQLGIESDAARRFSGGLDNNLALEGIKRAVYLVKKVAGGKLAGWQDQSLVNNFQEKIKLEINKVARLIGEKVSLKEIQKILKIIGCEITKVNQDSLIVIPPHFRKDLNIQEDLIEEIVRLRGYMNLPATLPNLPLVSASRHGDKVYQNRLRDILKGAGFSEAYNYAFVSKKMLEIADIQQSIAVANPISERFTHLRPSLLMGLLQNVAENLKYNKTVRLFEMGKVFQKEKGFLTEKSHLSLMMSGQYDIFFELKGVIELVFKSLGISDYIFEVFEEEISQVKEFCPAPLAEIKLNDEKIGCLGKISDKILKQLKINQTTVAAYLDLEKLLHFAHEEFEYRPPSKYPAVMRDVALLIDKKVRFSTILNVIDNIQSDLIQDVDVFDIYEGDKLPHYKKSLAFHITYQSYDHTLTDKEVNQEHLKVEEALKKQLKAVIR